MSVFDAHTHLGESLVSGKVISEDGLLAVCEQYSVVCSNIYLETSWCSAGDIAKMIREVCSDWMMMGSDGPENLAVELAK